MGAAATGRKQMAMSEPSCFVLQAAGYWCCKLGVALCPHHVAGERNVWADALTRDALHGFDPSLQLTLDS